MDINNNRGVRREIDNSFWSDIIFGDNRIFVFILMAGRLACHFCRDRPWNSAGSLKVSVYKAAGCCGYVTSAATASRLPSLIAALRTRVCLGTQRMRWNSAPRVLRGPWLAVSGASLLAGVFLTSALRHPPLPRLPEARCQALESTEDEDKPPASLGLLLQLRVLGRLVFLTALFLPAAILSGLALFLDSRLLYELAWKYTLGAVQVAGPAFIKLAQWASTRRDLFSDECCSILSRLLTSCDPHDWNQTAKILEQNLGPDWENTFLFPDHKPIGSGCVAQVYKGYLNLDSPVIAGNPEVADVVKMKPTSTVLGKRCISMAIKVLHPGVIGAMEMDILLMRFMASWADFLYPNFHWICLIECVEEFSKSMHKQVTMAKVW